MMSEINPDLLKQLAEKWLNGSINTQELDLLDKWYNQASPDEIIWNSVDRNEQELKMRLYHHVQTVIGETATEPSAIKKLIIYPLWKKIATVAAIACIVLGIYFFNAGRNLSLNPSYANDIAPGGKTATLTLANGKKISLMEAKQGELASQSGVEIIKASDGRLVYRPKSGDLENKSMQFNTIETPRGGEHQVVLPDGSTVYLNALSSIKFPASFKGLVKRTVELQGEAYFEISKDRAHPFIVKTARQAVEVLGTHFNINSYTDEMATRTTLLEGSIRITESGTGVVNLLVPGEQASLDTKSITVKKVDVNDAVDWKNGDFVFANAPLEEIMRKVSRWYDVNIIYQDRLPGKTVYGTVPRYKNVSEILKTIEFIKVARFKIEGRNIIVMNYK